MTRQMRIPAALVAMAIVGMALTVSGCGSSGSAGASAVGGPIEVEVSQLFITVTNKSGGPLRDVKVEIVPVGRQTIFTATHYRLESEADHDFSMADLRGNDGTPFNLRIHKPQTVRVTAKGLSDEYTVEVPWG